MLNKIHDFYYGKIRKKPIVTMRVGNGKLPRLSRLITRRMAKKNLNAKAYSYEQLHEELDEIHRTYLKRHYKMSKIGVYIHSCLAITYLVLAGLELRAWDDGNWTLAWIGFQLGMAVVFFYFARNSRKQRDKALMEILSDD